MLKIKIYLLDIILHNLKSIGKNVEKLEPLCTANGNVKWWGHFGKQMQFFKWLNRVFFSFLLSICLFIYLWLCWVFVSVRGLSLVVASGGHSSPRCAGPSPPRPLPLRSTGSRCPGSVIVAHGPSRSAARGILPDRGSNPCPLHWPADSQPLRHQGSPKQSFYMTQQSHS